MPEASKQQLLEELGEDLPEIFLHAFNAPETTKITLFNDGDLLQKCLGEDRKSIGVVTAPGAAVAAIHKIAKNLDIKIERRFTDIIEGEILIRGARFNFTANLPPDVNGPMFTLRKIDPQILALEIALASDLFLLNAACISQAKKPQAAIKSDRTAGVDLLLRQIHWFCDAKIADAIRTCAMKSASYSLTSKTHSLWSLVRTHIDPAVKDYLNQANWPSLKILGFLSPGFSESAKLNSLRGTQKSIKAVIRYSASIERARNFPENFTQTLESLLYLLEFMAMCERKQNISLVTSPFGTTRRTLKYKADATHHFPYCELCWRLSAFAQAAKDGLPTSKIDGEGKVTDLSRRLCEEHDSTKNNKKSSNNSKKEDADSDTRGLNYRTGINYRDAFHAKVLECYRVLCWVPGVYDEQDREIRRFAYEFVRLSDNSIQIMRMKREGLSQEEIAVKLGIRPKTVSKHLRGLSPYFKELMASSLFTKSSARKCV